MKRVILVILACIGVSVIVSVTHSIGVNAAHWNGDEVQVVGRSQLAGVSPPSTYPCDGIEAPALIEGYGRVSRACIYGDTTQLRVVRFIGSSTFRYGVSFPGNDSFYEIRGLCPYPRCVYSASSDSILMHHYLPAWRYGAGLYKNFSKSLKRHFDDSTQRYFYQFEPTQGPDFIPKIGDTEPSIEAMSFSLNGKWAIIEMRSYGFMRLNVETLEARRVVAPGATYGLFNDPSYELVISNDGRYIVTTGFRATTALYEIDSQCGDYVQAISGTYFSAYARPCRQINFSVNDTLTGIFHGFNPRLNSAGDRLGISVLKSNSEVERVILAPKSEDRVGLHYLALGDSFTSGEGETSDTFYKVGSNQDRLKCHTSVRSYPYLVANGWKVQAENIACSGARTNDILATHGYEGQKGFLKDMSESDKAVAKETALSSFQAGVIPQLNFVSQYQPNIVSISVGGNDAGLIGKLTSCLNVTTCEWAENPVKRFASAKEIAAIYPKVREVIRSIRAHSPSSRILVVGYPQIIDSTDHAKCDSLTGILLNATERIFMNESVKYLNQVLQRVAQSEGLQFMDINNSLNKHELCGQTDATAMNAVRLGDDIAPVSFLKEFRLIGSESFHPTPKGHQAIATDILKTFPDSGLVGECQECSELDEAPNAPAYWGEYSDGQYVRQIQDATMTKVTAKLKGILSIASLPYLFTPGTPIVAEIHSEITEIGKGIASDDGSYHLETTLPSSIKAGYHTIHLLGTGLDGNPVDVYQAIAIEADRVKSVEEDTTEAAMASNNKSSNSNNDRVLTRWISSDVDTNSSLKDTKLRNELGVLGVNTLKLPSDKMAVLGEMQDSPERSSSILTILFILLGLLIVCSVIYVIIFVIHLRHSSRELTG